MRTIGAGAPAVVLVHCWGGTADEWSEVIPAIAAHHQVIALDLPGHGRSGKARAAWTVPAYAADVRAVLDALGVERAILVGHSMAGAIVVQAAVEQPSRVVGVIPVDTLQDVGAKGEDPRDQELLGALRARFPETVDAFVRMIMPKTADPKVIARVVAFEQANDPAIAVAVLETNWKFPVAAPFAKLTVPVIAINADLFPTNEAGNRALQPRYQLRLIKGVGHWPMLEAPAAFAAELSRAIAELSAPPAR